MQNLAVICLLFLRKGFVVRSLPIPVPICSSLTACLAKNLLRNLSREVLEEDGLELFDRGRNREI